MKKRVIKLIVCIMLIAALMIGFSSAYASAASPVWLLRAKAGIAAAMMAANISFEAINAAQGQALANAIDPLGIVQTVNDTSWDRYIDQSVIVVRPDYVTIDGEQYSEIWLGSEAANALRSSGFDFTTAYNILANQTEAVKYANGVGDYDGCPVYSLSNGTYRTPSYNATCSIGSAYQTGNIILGPFEQGASSTRARAKFTYTSGQASSWSITGTKDSPVSYFWQSTNQGSTWRYWDSFAQSLLTAPNSLFTSDSFEFDYTSGNIDAEPIDPEDGLLLRVPSSYYDGPDSPYNYNIPDYVNSYPDVDNTNGRQLVFDPNLNPDFDVDLDIGNALGDLITAVILAKLADLLGDNADTIYAPMPEKDDPEPQPGIIDPLPDPDPAPDDPSPGTTIANTDWTKLDEILRWIQSTIDSIRHLTESLQTMLDSIFDAIQSAIQHIAEIPEAIRELADKILEDIELGPAKLFDKALDILKTLFLPLLLPIRAMMNLWHYVVEWIQSITSPFTWIFGIMSGTSGNMVLPIYALLAGGICISIYKALGR